MVSPVTRRRGAVGSRLVIAGSLLLGAATAVIAHPWHAPSSRLAGRAPPATNATAPGVASAWVAASVVQPPIVVPSPPAIAEVVRAVVKAPHFGPRVRAATIASADVAPATPPAATPPTVDKSATF
jgi:hypothetical protein